MKKINKIIYIFVLGLLATACSVNEDNILFDPINGQTLVNFAVLAENLPVVIDEAGSVDIQIEVTTISTVDRIFNVQIIEGENQTTANPASFSVGQALVPANSFLGNMTVSGIDVNVEVTPEIIVLALVEENGIITDQPIRISIFEVCPVPETFFSGEYLIEDVSANIGPNNGTSNFTPGVFMINTVEGDATGTLRTFSNAILPAFRGEIEITISMVCGFFQLNNTDPDISCNGGDSQYIYVNAGANNATYDLNFAPGSDDVFVITYIEDPAGSCGGPFNSSVRFTRQ